jgi:hypothetical protein
VSVQVTASNSAGQATASSTVTAVVTSGLAPTTPVLDDFNRANGGAGSNWLVMRPSVFAPMNLSGNTAVDLSTTLYAWNAWNAVFGPNCEAYITMTSYTGTDTIRVGGRVANVGTTTYQGYYVSISSTGGWSIIRITNATATTLASGVNQPLAAGDKIAIRIVGSTITALHYTPSGGWLQVETYDTSRDTVRYTAAGNIAVEFRGSKIDDFGGGSLP